MQDGAGFFDNLSGVNTAIMNKAQSVGQSISGALATGVLRVILAADNTVINVYRSSAKNMAARNPQRIDAA